MFRDNSLRNLSPVARRLPSVCMKPLSRSLPLARAAAFAESGSGGLMVNQKWTNSEMASPSTARSSILKDLRQLPVNRIAPGRTVPQERLPTKH